MVPMNVEIALNIKSATILCPCCNTGFNPFEQSVELMDDEIIEELKDHLVIEKSLENNHRLYDDC
jgi:hypothetical protein